MDWLKRFDEGLARGEARLATLFLVNMIFAGCAQAVMRHFATDWEAVWANQALGYLDWVDPFLQKGTLWLSFLGASLATREGRHIGIDILPRLAPPKIKRWMRATAGLASSVVAFFLARAFWSAVLINAEERPANYEVYGDAGPIHLCDATAAQLADASLDSPGLFCGVRTLFEGIGIPVETPSAALQLIVPAMFVMISIRLLANAIKSVLPGAELEESHEVKMAREQAERDAALALATGESSAEIPAPDGVDAGDDEAPQGASAEAAPPGDEAPADEGAAEERSPEGGPTEGDAPADDPPPERPAASEGPVSDGDDSHDGDDKGEA